MLGNIQALRAVAALMVVVVHAYAVESTYLPGRPWTTPFHVLGTYGVDLFFVISGTVMVASTAGWFGKPGSPLRFLTRRATRIYPPYWIVSALVLVAFLVVPAATGCRLRVCSDGAQGQGPCDWSDLRHAAVNEHFASGHETAVLGRKEERHGCRLLRKAHASDGCLGDQA